MPSHSERAQAGVETGRRIVQGLAWSSNMRPKTTSREALDCMTVPAVNEVLALQLRQRSTTEERVANR